MRRPLAFLLLAGILTGLPGAHAALVPEHDFDGSFRTEPLAAPEGEGGGGAEAAPPSVYVMGAMSVDGDASGLFVFAGVQPTAIERVGRVEVYELSGDPSRVDREQFRITGRPIHRAFDDALVEVPANASLYYWVPEDSPHGFEADSPLALALPVLPPDIQVAEFGVLYANASLLATGGLDSTLTMGSRGEAYLMAANPATGFHVTSQADTDGQTFTGTGYLLRLIEASPARFDAEAAVLPLGNASAVDVRPAPSDVLAERFDVDRFLDGVRRFMGAQEGETTTDQGTGNTSLVDPRVAQVFDALSPMLNGAIIGNLPNGTISVAAADAPAGLEGFTYVRASTLTLRGLDDGVTVAYSGTAPLLLYNKEFYSDEPAVGGPPLPIPVLSLLLWPVAAAAILLAFLVRLPVAPTAPGVGSMLRVAGFVVNIALGLLAFVLWDAETRAFLGTSLLTLLFGGANPTGIGVGLVAGLQGLSLGLAFLFLGLPIRLAANAVLRLVQLKRARGFGAGIGHVASWGLGAPMMPLLLTPLAGVVSGLGF